MAGQQQQSLGLVDEEEDGIKESLLAESSIHVGEQENAETQKSVPRVDKLWQEHHGVLRNRGKKKRADLGAAIALLISALFALGVLLYSLGKGQIEVLQRVGGRGGWVGEGLLQVSHRKGWVFALVPLQSGAIAVVWLLLLAFRPKALIFLTIFIAPLVGFAAGVTLLRHAFAHNDDILLACGCFWVAWCLWFALRSCRKDTLTPVVAAEASFRLWIGGGARGVALVAGTMCLVVFFLWAALIASVAHLWSIPDESGSKLREGPRWLIPSLLLAALWCMSWLDAVLRLTISSVVSAKYFGSSSQCDACSASALESLHTAVWSNTPPVATGSALVGGSRALRVIQVWLEGFGERGKGTVSLVCGLCPILMPSVYLGPHAYVLLAQGGRGGFMSVAREAFKVLARNGLAKASHNVAQARVFAGIRTIAASAGILLIATRLSKGDEKLHTLVFAVACIVGDAVLSTVTSIIHFSMDAVVVCYAKELEACQPNPPQMCSATFHSALEACTEHEVQDNEHRYSTDRQAAHSGDRL